MSSKARNLERSCTQQIWALKLSTMILRFWFWLVVSVGTSLPGGWADESGGRDFKLQHCSCRRDLPALTPSDVPDTPSSGREDSCHAEISYEDTTCSQDAFHRGPGQKVVGMCFYGKRDTPSHESRHYFEGIEENLQNMAKFYPDWVMRVYYNASLDRMTRGELCDLACQYDNLDLCHVGRLPNGGIWSDVAVDDIFPMTWRFLPVLDQQVDVLISRDLDSRITSREQSAVQEFLDSDMDFHIMRDHPQHVHPIMGGLWGCKANALRREWRESWTNMVKDKTFHVSFTSYGADQYALAEHVWPWAKEVALIHDSYNCDKYRTPMTRPFPTQRKYELDNYTGSLPFPPGYRTLWEKCPETCRPQNHPDWLYC